MLWIVCSVEQTSRFLNPGFRCNKYCDHLLVVMIDDWYNLLLQPHFCSSVETRKVRFKQVVQLLELPAHEFKNCSQIQPNWLVIPLGSKPERPRNFFDLFLAGTGLIDIIVETLGFLPVVGCQRLYSTNPTSILLGDLIFEWFWQKSPLSWCNYVFCVA